MTPECYEGLHRACGCENACECRCHLRDQLLDEESQFEPDQADDEEYFR